MSPLRTRKREVYEDPRFLRPRAWVLLAGFGLLFAASGDSDTAAAGPDVWDYHVAPRRQFVIHLVGVAEIEVGGGDRRRFGPGEILLADDTTGQGHISREVEGPRLQIFVALDGSADVESWRG